MGRYSYSHKTTVEECKSINTKWLKDNGYFCGFKWGGMKWTNNTGEETGNIGFQVSIKDGDSYIRFQYSSTDRSTQEKKELDYKNSLVSTPCNYEGRRWWFICGLIVNGNYCGRKVGKLYLVPGGIYFGCRHCYNLTYRSCQEHDNRIDRLMKNPFLLASLLDSKNPNMSFLAMKAYFKLTGKF